MKIAVILPSRGLIFSETADELLRNLKGFGYKFYFSHRRPIPECFELPTLQALDDPETTHLLFVEDDMILPDGVIGDMMALQKDVVTCDYPVTRDGKGAVFKDPGGNVVYCGTGCLLVRREVFERIQTPYWRSDIRWTPLNYDTTVKLVGSMFGREGYGLHDVTFGVKLWLAGIPIQVHKRIGQRKLIALGQSGTNNGAHQIEEWRKVVSKYQLKKIRSQPIAPAARTALVTVDTPTGGLRVSRKHAASLIEQGLATAIDYKRAIIDDLEVKW